MRGHFIFMVLLLAGLCYPGTAMSQYAYRFKAKFTIKEKTLQDKLQLTKGTVYYDKNIGKLVYRISFPEPATLMIADTNYYLIQYDSLMEKRAVPAIGEYTLFHQGLSGNLQHYGLEETPYKIASVSQEDDMVITTWIPEGNLKKLMGKIVMSHKQKQLYGIVFFDKKGKKVIRKLFFKDYVNLDGFIFPQEIVQITYRDEEEYYKVTTFKEIAIDDKSENGMYDLNVPD